jgi:long-chain acyl-CoA synthetase
MALVQDAVERMNLRLPRFATVKRFAILPAELGEATGEVTPSQKLRRRVVEARHRRVLDDLYGAAAPHAPGRTEPEGAAPAAPQAHDAARASARS